MCRTEKAFDEKNIKNSKIPGGQTGDFAVKRERCF